MDITLHDYYTVHKVTGKDVEAIMQLYYKLQEAGYVLDIHEENIMLKNDRWYLVDFCHMEPITNEIEYCMWEEEATNLQEFNQYTIKYLNFFIDKVGYKQQCSVLPFITVGGRKIVM